MGTAQYWEAYTEGTRPRFSAFIFGCPSGSWSEGGTCAKCSPGKSTDSVAGAVNSSFCLPCGVGTFSSVSGSENCTSCFAGTFIGVSGASECLPCPVGSYCPAGSVAGSRCPPGTNTHLQGMTQCSTCIVPAHCLGGADCVAGYAHALCGSCAPKYFLTPEGRCEACPVIPIGVIVVVGGVLLLLVVFLGLQLSTIFVSKLKIIIVFLQCCSVALSIRIPWPPLVAFVRDWVLTYLTVDLKMLAPECFIDGMNWDMRFWIVVGLIVSVLVTIRILQAMLNCAVADKAFVWNTKTRLHLRMRKMFYVVVGVVYIPLTRMCISSFLCIEASQVSVLQEDTSVDCSSSQHFSVQVASGILLGIVSGLYPMSFCFDTGAGAWRYSLRESYRPDLPYFESIVMVRKALFAVFSVTLISQPLNQAIAMVVIGAVYLLIVWALKPFVLVPVRPGFFDRILCNQLNYAEIVTSFAVLFACCCALGGAIDPTFGGTMVAAVLGYLTVGFGLCGIVSVVVASLLKRSAVRKYRGTSVPLKVLGQGKKKHDRPPYQVLLGPTDGTWLEWLQASLSELSARQGMGIKRRLLLLGACGMWIERLTQLYNDRLRTLDCDDDNDWETGYGHGDLQLASFAIEQPGGGSIDFSLRDLFSSAGRAKVAEEISKSIDCKDPPFTVKGSTAWSMPVGE